MNKKIISLVSFAMIPALFLVAVIEWASGRLLPYGPAHNLAFNAIEVVATLLVLQGPSVWILK